MQSSAGDDDERESVGSPDGSSDNDQDGAIEDRDDVDMDGDVVGEGDGEAENEDDNEDEDEEQDDSQYSYEDGPNRGQLKPAGASQASLLSNNSTSGSNNFGGPSVSAPTSNPNPNLLLTSPSPTQGSSTSNGLSYDAPKIRPEVLTAPVYDIVPTIAAPHSTSINAITATPDLRWVFSGGADGYIRKFNWIETANGKSMLTVAQRHPFVDSVTKAGVLMSYWENGEDSNAKPSDDSSSVSSVYSLAVQHDGLWLLSGLESGGINLQSVRHDEGKQIACLRGHTSAVSVLKLSQDEQSLLSGSWDKNVFDWDLNTGKTIRSFEGSGGQISALETRPLSSLPVPQVSEDFQEISNTFSTNGGDGPRINGSTVNGVDHDYKTDIKSTENGINGTANSPTDSLFGGNDVDSLFGDNDNVEAAAPSGGNFGEDEDDEFSIAIANGIREQEQEQEQEQGQAISDQNIEGDVHMTDAGEAPDLPLGEQILESQAAPDLKPVHHFASEEALSSSSTLSNDLPHDEKLPPPGDVTDPGLLAPSEPWSKADSTFLAASFDGSLRIWDKRQSTAVAKMTPRNVPPWCMNACWSPDGNFIYAGRRNGTVDEYSLHKGLRGAERSFKLPNNSGAVSAVRAMPNGRHLICASYDILRLYDLQQQQIFKHATVPFLIVPGHRTGVVSQLYIDPACRYLISTAGNRGWEGSNTEVLLGYEIGVPR